MTGGIVVHISRLVVIVQAGFDLMGRMSRAKFVRRFPDDGGGVATGSPPNCRRRMSEALRPTVRPSSPKER